MMIFSGRVTSGACCTAVSCRKSRAGPSVAAATTFASWPPLPCCSRSSVSTGAGSLYIAAAAATSRMPLAAFTPSRGPAGVRMFSSVMLRGISNPPGSRAWAAAVDGPAREAAVAEATPATVDFRNERRSEDMRTPC